MIGGKGLGHRGVERGAAGLVHLPAGPAHEQPRRMRPSHHAHRRATADLDANGHVGDERGYGLVVGNRLAHGLALHGVLGRLVLPRVMLPGTNKRRTSARCASPTAPAATSGRVMSKAWVSWACGAVMTLVASLVSVRVMVEVIMLSFLLAGFPPG